jgi:hypothetical protein
MELVAKWGNVKDYISNNENVIEIKWDPFVDNISVPYKDFYKFINKKLETIYLFQKNAFLDDVVKRANIYINTNVKKVK